MIGAAMSLIMLRSWLIYMPPAQHPEKFAALSGAGRVRPLSDGPLFESIDPERGGVRAG